MGATAKAFGKAVIKWGWEIGGPIIATFVAGLLNEIADDAIRAYKAKRDKRRAKPATPPTNTAT